MEIRYFWTKKTILKSGKRGQHPKVTNQLISRRYVINGELGNTQCFTFFPFLKKHT